jgi:hypothetical protein
MKGVPEKLGTFSQSPVSPPPHEASVQKAATSKICIDGVFIEVSARRSTIHCNWL